MVAILLLCFFCILPVSKVNATTFDFEKFDNIQHAEADMVARNTMGVMIRFLQIFGAGSAIVILTYMGIKYVVSAPDEKAEFKKSMTIYILGAVLVFAASNILAIVVDFASNSVKPSTNQTSQIIMVQAKENLGE